MRRKASSGATPRIASCATLQAETLDPVLRRTLVGQLQQRLADELPTIPLYVRRFYWIYDSTKYTPMNTWGGLMNGIPLAQNKLSFLRR